MDITSLNVVEAASEATPMPLRHPGTEEPTGIVFLVLGYDSDKVVQAARSFASKMMAKRKKMAPDVLMRLRAVALAKAAIVGLEEGSEPIEVHPSQYGDTEPQEPSVRKIVPVPSKEFNALLDNPGFLFISQQTAQHGDDRGNYLPEAQTD